MSALQIAAIPVRLRRWTARPSGALRGFADVVLDDTPPLLETPP